MVLLLLRLPPPTRTCSPFSDQVFQRKGKGLVSVKISAGIGIGLRSKRQIQRDHVKLDLDPVAVVVVPPLVAAAAAAALTVLSPMCFPPAPAAAAASIGLGQTADVEKGGSLFRRACIGCHDAGGNIIQPGATLFLEDLRRNGVDAEEEIYRVTYYGKGRMPGFGENCTPRGQCTFGPRLTEDEIKVLAEFVKSQADQGWTNIPAAAAAAGAVGGD